MHIALWNTPSADFFLSGMEGAGQNWEVERASPRRCVDLLRQGQVDVALVSTLVVLTNPDAFDVLPGVALSTWKNPFARLVLREGLQQADTVAYAPEHMQEAFVAQVVLQEHYGQEAEFQPHLEATTEELVSTRADAVLVVGNEAPMHQSGALVLDLGQEWFELSAYPMVWGLFVTRKDEATPGMVAALREMVRAAEARRSVWVRAQERPPVLHAFFTDDLRLRFDDLVTASLTEFRQYLYYYKVTEEIPELPLYEVPDETRDDDARDPLL